MTQSIPQNIPNMFFATSERFSEKRCLGVKREGRYRYNTYREVAQSVRWLAAALQARGVQRGERVALLSNNRPEWPLWDLAALTLGAVLVPIYPTLTPKQVEWILNDCHASWLTVENGALLEPLLSHLPAMPSVRTVCLLERAESAFPVLYSQDLLEEGRSLTLQAPQLSPEDLATIVYTSGTTGDPKGVMLSHGNLVANALALVDFERITSDDSCLSFLPLSHAFERMSHFMFFASGGTISYAENVAAVVSNLPEVSPTIVVSVPRVFEKVRSRMLENILASSAITKNIFFWSLRNGQKARHLRHLGRKVSLWLSLKLAIADFLVFRKARSRFGGKLRFFVSGGAPLVPEVGEFFEVLGFTILEGYGLTETSPVVAANQERKVRLGTVGTVMPGVEVRLGEDGEVQVKGPNVMQGYYNQPELTAEVLRDGWFCTGDIGELDADGYLRIVDRKKELLIMSNGKNVAPQPIENALKKSKLVSMAMVVGDRRNYLTALIVPNWDPLIREAKKLGLDAPPQELIKEEKVKALYRAEIDRLMVDYARFEQIKAFTLLAEEFSQDRNEMTPTLKFKRPVILQAYREQIEAMYGLAAEKTR